MARNFPGTTSDYLINTTITPLSYPFTLACWAWNDEDVNLAGLIMISNPTNVESAWLTLDDFGNDVVANSTDTGGLGSSADSTGNYPVGSWFHAAGTWVAINERNAFMNGANKGTNTVSRDIDEETLDTVTLGVRNTTAISNDLNGRMAEVGIWDDELTDAEIASLGAGVCPLMIRPDALVHYWPLFGRASPEPDWIRGNHLTINGTVAKEEHPPRIIYPNDQSAVRIPFFLEPDWALKGTLRPQRFGQELMNTAEHPPQIIYPQYGQSIRSPWFLEPDWVGDNPMREFGSVPKAENPPRLIYPQTNIEPITPSTFEGHRDWVGNFSLKRIGEKLGLIKAEHP